MLVERARPPRLVRFVPLMLPLGLAIAAACGSDDSSKPWSGSGATSDVVFHADVSAITGLSYDTGLLPAGSPVQLQLKVAAKGNGAIDALAVASGASQAPVLTSKPGSGKVAIAG